MRNIDLHIHTNLSDGLSKPSEVVIAAKKRAISQIVLTDHNCVYDKHNTIVKFAYKHGIEIPFQGCEINATFTSKKGIKYKHHVLIYGKNLNQSKILEIASEYNRVQNEWILNQANYVCDLFGIDKDEVKNTVMYDELIKLRYKKGLISRTEIAKKISERTGYQLDFLKEMFFPKISSEEKYRVAIDLNEIISIAARENLLVVIAHPGWIRHMNGDNIEENLDEYFEDILTSGIDGCEVYHRLHSNDIMEKLRNKCIEKNILITGGSDYHGKPRCIMGEFLTTEEQFDFMKRRLCG